MLSPPLPSPLVISPPDRIEERKKERKRKKKGEKKHTNKMPLDEKIRKIII
jgi:hypothetical protein